MSDELKQFRDTLNNVQRWLKRTENVLINGGSLLHPVHAAKSELESLLFMMSIHNIDEVPAIDVPEIRDGLRFYDWNEDETCEVYMYHPGKDCAVVDCNGVKHIWFIEPMLLGFQNHTLTVLE